MRRPSRAVCVSLFALACPPSACGISPRRGRKFRALRGISPRRGRKFRVLRGISPRWGRKFRALRGISPAGENIWVCGGWSCVNRPWRAFAFRWRNWMGAVVVAGVRPPLPTASPPAGGENSERCAASPPGEGRKFRALRGISPGGGENRLGGGSSRWGEKVVGGRQRGSLRCPARSLSCRSRSPSRRSLQLCAGRRCGGSRRRWW